jgi:RNA polymerase sigma-70 factor (ECF subfamily)
MEEIAIALQMDAEQTETPTDRAELFSALIDRHASFLYRVAFTLLRNPQDAEDAVQDALLKLYRGDAWQKAAEERAFLAQCVWRAGLDRLGTAAAKAMRHAEDVSALDLPGVGADPEMQAAEAQQRSLMRRLIEALPETLRQPLLLSAIDGLRSNEVAQMLGIPEGTVRTRLMRARAELRASFLAATTPAVGGTR